MLLPVYCFNYSLILKMEAICFPETSDFSEFHYVVTHITVLMPLCSHHLTTGSFILLQTLNCNLLLRGSCSGIHILQLDWLDD
jgi:hypothetical protein